MISAMGLFACMFAATIGAIALDVTSLISARTHLQAAVDQAAHAAIYQRNKDLNERTESQAKQDALDLVSAILPSGLYGTPIRTGDITFGTYDYSTSTFTETANATEAVRVNAFFNQDRQNSVTSFLWRFVGVDRFDIVASATFVAFQPECLNQGFNAEVLVDIQSNNTFFEGFCIHSNGHVEIQNGNQFNNGAKISMPDLGDFVMPDGGLENNTGVQDALVRGFRKFRVLEEIDEMRTGLLTNDANYIPDYITDPIPVSLNAGKLSDGDLEVGKVYNVACNGNRLTVSFTQPLVGVVIVTDCEVRFGSGTELQDSLVLTTNTNAGSISSPSNLKVGKRDNCAPGGGAMLVTMGGMNFPAQLEAMRGNSLRRATSSLRRTRTVSRASIWFLVERFQAHPT